MTTRRRSVGKGEGSASVSVRSSGKPEQRAACGEGLERRREGDDGAAAREERGELALGLEAVQAEPRGAALPGDARRVAGTGAARALPNCSTARVACEDRILRVEAARLEAVLEVARGREGERLAFRRERSGAELPLQLAVPLHDLAAAGRLRGDRDDARREGERRLAQRRVGRGAAGGRRLGEREELLLGELAGARVARALVDLVRLVEQQHHVVERSRGPSSGSRMAGSRA